MRVRITFQVKNRGSIVPFHHQHLLAQIFKGLLISADNHSFKDYAFYSFSGVKGQTRVSKKGLQYTSRRVTIVISSISPEFLNHLIGLIMNQEKLEVGGLEIIPDSVEKELAVTFEHETKYLCISPLILKSADFNSNESKNFYDPMTDQFSDFLYETTMQRIAAYGLDPENIPNAHKFQIVPDDEYLKRLKDSNKKFSRIYPVFDQDVKYEVRGYTFPFTLFAAPEIQEFVFTCGLGSYCNKGFGMLDIANADPTERIIPLKSHEELISA